MLKTKIITMKLKMKIHQILSKVANSFKANYHQKKNTFQIKIEDPKQSSPNYKNVQIINSTQPNTIKTINS